MEKQAKLKCTVNWKLKSTLKIKNKYMRYPALQLIELRSLSVCPMQALETVFLKIYIIEPFVFIESVCTLGSREF